MRLYTELLQSPALSCDSIRSQLEVKAVEECLERTDFHCSSASQGKECRQGNQGQVNKAFRSHLHSEPLVIYNEDQILQKLTFQLNQVWS